MSPLGAKNILVWMESPNGKRKRYSVDGIGLCRETQREITFYFSDLPTSSRPVLAHLSHSVSNHRTQTKLNFFVSLFRCLNCEADSHLEAKQSKNTTGRVSEIRPIWGSYWHFFQKLDQLRCVLLADTAAAKTDDPRLKWLLILSHHSRLCSPSSGLPWSSTPWPRVEDHLSLCPTFRLGHLELSRRWCDLTWVRENTPSVLHSI